MTERSYLSHPHLHGDRIVWVCEDDVWLASLGGGAGAARAWRVTADRSRTSCPRISPDGRTLARVAWRSLDPEVHVESLEGGPSRQVTHWGGPETRVRGWTPSGEVLAVGSHAQPFAHYTWAYTVPPDGGPGDRLPWGPVTDLALGTLGGREAALLLVGAAPHEPTAWKRYRGGATGRLWLDGERLRPVDSRGEPIDGHLDCPMLVGDRVAFLSDHEGVGNLYSCLPDGTDLLRHTDHDAFYARHAATDGERIVYQCAGELWLVESPAARAARPRRLDFRLGGPRIGRRPRQVRAADHLDAWACDTTGRAGAVGVAGSLYWLTHREGPARVISDVPGVRARLPVMLGSTGRLAWVTDAAGEDAVAVAGLPRTLDEQDQRRGGRRRDAEADAAAAEAARDADAAPADPAAPGGPLLAAGRLGRVEELAAAPDGTRLAVATGDGRVLAVRVADGAVRELAASSGGPVTGLAFSPDSAWLAWSEPGDAPALRRIVLCRPDGRERVAVTDGRFEDEAPVFTRDGRYLAFLSWRGFDPVYDVHTLDLSFPLGSRPYLVPLDPATPSPFAPPLEGRPPSGAVDLPEAGGDGTVRLDPEGLAERVVPFPVQASKYSSLAAVAGGLVWLRWPISGALGETFADPDDTSGRPSLEYFDLAKGARTRLVEDLDGFVVSGDGTRLVVNDDGDLRAVPADEPADAETTVPIDLGRIMHEVDPAAQWRQAFDEAGRLMRHYFWSADMCGVDWDAVLEQYRPLVERVATPGEFADLLREAVGELGTSHAYVQPSRRDEGPPRYQRPIGLLGADFVQDGSAGRAAPDGEAADGSAADGSAAEGGAAGGGGPGGTWRIARVLPGESSDPRARSPLAGTGVRPGDALLAVDGRPVDPRLGPWPLLAAAGNVTCELTVRPAAGGAPRRVAVVPLVDERPLRYHDWVVERRSLVRRLSGGCCGYLHIPDLGGSGWAQFNRDLRLELTRDALVLDVRGNAGGQVSELVVEKLSRTLLGWDLTRDARPVTYPGNAPRGPIVALADEATSSDGDMITAAIKLLGLGPVIGTRTWGGVVGMTGRHRLGDGTVITVPMNAAWFDAYGWSVENHGVEPDIEVPRTPRNWETGEHAQMSAAVGVALKLLEERPAARPPSLADRPDRSRPPLPPRG